MLTMLASIVIPTRNRPQLLEVALAAVAEQTYRDIEVIVIDDGSDAANAQHNARLAAALGPVVNYQYLTCNNPRGSGPAYVRNLGLLAASGAIIAFCDDDDFWCDRRHLEVASAAFTADASLDMMFANQETRVDGKPERSIWLPSLVARLPAASRDSDEVLAVTKSDCLIDDHGHMNTCVFRRELLAQISGFWEEIRYLEDLDLFVRAIDAARGIGYRPRTVSVHNVPNHAARANASTRIGHSEKKLVELTVADHLMQSCRSMEARRFADRMAGYSYRGWALQAAAAGQHGRAFKYACVAMAWKPTWKWLGYLGLSAARAVLAGLGLTRG